jgi:hypothetical protein
VYAGGGADVSAGNNWHNDIQYHFGYSVTSQTLWPGSSKEITFALPRQVGITMKSLMKELTKTCLIIFGFAVIFLWLALIFKFAVDTGAYRSETDITVRPAAEQIVTE